mmetsp:Transcript_55108/g.165060  ORF Transcript_55108/g.165060 Transcript_55108/m.165060 type:complete len:892 (-) Transcript_55108:44-2719(-)
MIASLLLIAGVITRAARVRAVNLCHKNFRFDNISSVRIGGAGKSIQNDLSILITNRSAIFGQIMFKDNHQSKEVRKEREDLRSHTIFRQAGIFHFHIISFFPRIARGTWTAKMWPVSSLRGKHGEGHQRLPLNGESPPLVLSKRTAPKLFAKGCVWVVVSILALILVSLAINEVRTETDRPADSVGRVVRRKAGSQGAVRDGLQKVFFFPQRRNGAYIFECCWRHHILEEAFNESNRLAVTYNDDEEGAYWMADITQFGAGRNAHNLLREVMASMERRQEVAKRAGKSDRTEDLGWKIFVVDHSDRGVFPTTFTTDHFCAIANLVGRDNLYFAQRSSVDGRRASDNSTLFHYWGQPRNYSSLLDGEERCIHRVVRHLDYTVRTDILNDIAGILQTYGNSTASESFKVDRTVTFGKGKLDPVSINRPSDVVHFWDPDEKVKNAVLRTRVSNRIRDLGEKYPDLSVFAGLAGQRDAEGRNSPQLDYAKALLEYKIVVVCQRDSHETHYRLMEALISGALVFTDPVHYLPDGFEDSKNIVVYNSLDDLEHKTLYYLQNDKERETIARNGLNLAITQHRARNWLEDFILGPWPVTSEKPLPMPQLTGSNYVTEQMEGKSTQANKASSALSRPLFIAAGQGTTGTRTMHDAMCNLGVPSVHYIKACYRRSKADDSVDGVVKMGVEAHYEAVSAWHEVMRCARADDCSFMEGVELEQELRSRIVSVINSGIGAIHDTPYPKYLSLILNAAQSRNSGPAILITSERNPKEWAVKRATGHIHDIVCKNPLAVFDLAHCVNLAKMFDPRPTKFSDLFVSYDGCNTEKEREDFISHLEDGMMRYQEKVVELSPRFHVNFWQEEVDTKLLAAGILNSVEAEKLEHAASLFGHALKSEIHRKS